jgi:hypothetical protein
MDVNPTIIYFSNKMRFSISSVPTYTSPDLEVVLDSLSK